LNIPLKEARDREKHHTYTIPEEPLAENSQIREETIKVGPGFKVQFNSNRFDTEDDVDSNISSMGFGRAYDRSVDFWMLGVLLFELIFGRTPFEKYKGTCDVLSKTPACPSYA
jgi:serine/threonine protein kinase